MKFRIGEGLEGSVNGARFSLIFCSVFSHMSGFGMSWQTLKSP
jgi:hypothetical protein